MLDISTLSSFDRDLYEPFSAYSSGFLDVDRSSKTGGHKLAWSVGGNPKGVPVLFLHGGPGGACHPVYRRFFDPKHYKIVLLDQRGSGRSLPYAGLAGNTTDALLDDIETLRKFLNIESWILFGGSWGSTLALLAAQKWPEHCLGLCLRGLFLARAQEIDWFFSGIRRFYPDAYTAFVADLPAALKETPLEPLYDRLASDDPAIHEPAAMAWNAFEARCASVEPRNINEVRGSSSLAIARLEAHYLKHRFFIEPNQILADMDKIKHLPACLLHGRFDMICLPEQAFELSRAWPKAELRIVETAGHAMMETAMRRALVGAMEFMKDISA